MLPAADSSDGAEPTAGLNDSGAGRSPKDSLPSRILVVLPNWVGDVVLSTPALRALRSGFAGAHIAFLVKPALAEVLNGGNWMDELIYWPTGKSRPKRRQGFLGLAAALRERRFDCAVLLTNSFRSALLARLAGIRRRIGYDRDGRGLLLTDRLLPERYDGKYVPVPMIRYYNSIARYLGCGEFPGLPELFTTSEEEQEAARAVAGRFEPGQPIIVVNSGASFGPAKCWPVERFAEVADRLVEEVNAAVFIACGPKEVQTARQVAAHMRHRSTVLDQPVMKLGPLKALIRRASLLITNDTGPRHFANAFGTPVVTIFGPTDPKWTATDSPTERSLAVSVHCGPCMKRTCPLDHRCMTRISSEMVLERAAGLLAERTPSSAG